MTPDCEGNGGNETGSDGKVVAKKVALDDLFHDRVNSRRTQFANIAGSSVQRHRCSIGYHHHCTLPYFNSLKKEQSEVTYIALRWVASILAPLDAFWLQDSEHLPSILDQPFFSRRRSQRPLSRPNRCLRPRLHSAFHPAVAYHAT